MKINFFKKSIIILLIFVLLGFLNQDYTLADYMQGSTYRLQSDSLNFGGVSSAGGTYKIEDSLGEIGTGDSNSSIYYMHAGFWQMQESSISISSPSDISMPSFVGLGGGASEATTAWIVTTDNSAGYNLSIETNQSPALSSTLDSFSDYTPVGSDPDFNFINADNNSSFGFSPEGPDTNSRFRDNGSICNSGSSENQSRCWDGLSTSPKVISTGLNSNMPAGQTTTLRLRAESGINRVQISGAYTANIIVTALTL